MNLDFWNNPIIVSAFRVRYRRGGLFNVTTIYLMLLVVGGILLYRYRDRFGGPWPRNYLLALFALQFFVSAIIAASTTAASIRNEVSNRTLDFQRISSLSPRQIVLGKLLGEPALAYLLAIATIPLTAWCCMLGVEGVSLFVLLLLYVNMATTTIMIGSLGLLQPLEASAGKTSTSAGLGAIGLVIGIQALIGARWLLTRNWSGALVGLVMPVTPFFGVYEGDPWVYSFTFFGRAVPFLLITPVTQLLLAWLCVQSTVRKLINPLDPAYSKATAYTTLLVFDLLAGAVLFEPSGLAMPLLQRSAAFCLAHLLACVGLINNMTPWRESLHSWIWRLRGRTPILRDLWLGSRSENGLALLTFCIMGAAGLGLFVLLPGILDEGMDKFLADRAAIVSVVVATTCLVLALGTLYQWCVAVGGRSGRGVFLSFALILIVPAHVAGRYWDLRWLEAVSPSAHFQQWLSQNEPLSLIPLLGTYGGLLVVTWVLLRRHIRRADRVVQRKLQLMGVNKAVA